MREMKDSGIEWIGEIPKDWCVKNGKYVFNVYGMSVNDDFINDTDEESYKIKYYKVDNLNEATEQFYIKSNFANFGIKIYEIKGPIILVPKRGGAIYTNKVRIEKEACLFDSNIMGLTTNNNVRFMAYVLYGRGLSDIGDVTTIPQINKKHIDVLKIPVPSINEQKVIVDYLDTQCSEIDATAEDIQKEISLLEDYKKSVITEAVTKGLNPDAEMKDSGIEWIGEIPKEWNVMFLKYLVQYNIDTLIESTDENFEFDYIDIGSVEYGKGIVNFQKLRFKDAPSRARRLVRENDVIVSTVRTYLKAIAQIPVYDKPIVVSTGFIALRALNKMNSAFLKYVIESNWFVSLIEMNSKGVSYPAINSSEVIQIKVVCPVLLEQQQIADYLDSKCSEIDSLIADKKRQLDILADYKKSLIYEYVTGKKEVPVNE